MKETKTNEMEAIVFYQMLIQEQNGKLDIFQESLFEVLLTKQSINIFNSLNESLL